MEIFTLLDVCVIGHVTKDLIRIPGRPAREMAGGSAHYVALALHALGLEVGVVTKVARADDALLDELRAANIAVHNLDTERTTTFENSYTDEHLRVRHQRVRSIADPFLPEEVTLEAHAAHVGPLTANEVSVAFLSEMRPRFGRISLDAQGMLRRVKEGAVTLESRAEAGGALAHVDILKVDDTEAKLLVGETDADHAARKMVELGAKETLLTFADRGSLVCTSETLTRIVAMPQPAIVDATGCGDTYVAGYLFARMQEEDVVAAARFAAGAASLKLGRYGALDQDAAAVKRWVSRSSV